MAFQSVKKFSLLDMTVFFLMYMYKLVCNKSDINQKAIGEQLRLGRNGGNTMYTN